MLATHSEDQNRRADAGETKKFELHALRQGDPIQLWERNVFRGSGIVDLSAPALGIIWIHQDGLGERKLILCPEYHLQQTPTSHWDLEILESED